MVQKSKGYTVLEKHCIKRVEALTKELVNEDSDETRGRIKEIEQLLNKVKSCLKTYDSNSK